MSRDRESRSLPPLPLGTRVAVVVSTYHHELTGAMGASAAETLRAAGVAECDLFPLEAPGAYELPIIAQRLARRDDVDAVLCFGLVLKGETEHDRYIAGAVADGLMRISLETETPVMFGVLTCGTLEQAQARARRREDGGLDKGHEVAAAAIRSLQVLEQASRPFGIDAKTTREAR
jgi:6,7-dimethyl-8-ribityllumazine synthase